MAYVFDTSSFLVLKHYYPERFPSFWEKLDAAVSQGVVLSVREVRNEIGEPPAETRLFEPGEPARKLHLLHWVKNKGAIFLRPSDEEMAFVAKIFEVPHFRYLVSERQRLRGTPVADPFVIACAKIKSACVVMQEEKKPNAAKIPNVCEHFGVECTNLEGFMAREGWEF